MSFTQVLTSLTTNPADRFGFGSRSGRVRKGMDGDLTVFNGDPGRDVAAFARVRYTVREGKLIFGEVPAAADR